MTTVSNTTGVINKAPLTITAIPNTKTYDGTTSVSPPRSTTPSATLIAGIEPDALAVDGSGNLYVANFGSSTPGTTVSVFAPGATTATSTLTGLMNPTSLVFDKSGNLFVSNFGANTVSKFAPGATTPTATFGIFLNPALAVDGHGNVYVSSGGAVSIITPGATSAQQILAGLNSIDNMAFDGAGHLYATQPGSNTVIEAQGANATLSGLDGPDPLAFAPNGNLFVGNFGNQGNPTGTSVSMFVPGAVTPSATLTGVNSPAALAFDRQGNLYVANWGSAILTPFAFTAGTTVSVFAPGSTSPTGALTGLSVPDALAFDLADNLYVANWGNGTVSKFSFKLPALSGLQGQDSVTGLQEVYNDPNSGAGKTLSVSAYTVNDGNGGNNYTVTTVTATTGTINPAPLTITATKNTKSYDSTTAAIAVPTVTGLVSADTVAGLSEAYTNSNAGTGKTLNVVSGFTINDGNGGRNYTFTIVANTAGVVSQAAVTIAAVPNTKTYDSTTKATVLPTISGLIGGDTATGLAEVYSSTNAGSNKALRVSAYIVNDGNDGNNYIVTIVDSTTGVINKASLSIAAITNTKPYDATITAAAVPVISGLVGEDSVSGVTETYSDKNAGSGATLSVSAYSVNDGNGGDNYTVTVATNTTGLITKAPLTIIAVTNTKFYDGTPSAAATPKVVGLQGNDTVQGLAEAYADPNIGTGKALSVLPFTVNDNNNGNNYIVATAINTTGVILPPVTNVSIVNTQGSELAPPKGGTTNYLFTIHLANAISQTISANYSTINGTGTTGAKAGTDFKGITNATVTIPAGARDIPLSVVILGGMPQLPGGPSDKYFTVQLGWAVSSGNYAQNLVTLSATGDIRQVFAPTVSIPASQIVHLASGTYGVAVNISSTYPSLSYAQADGTVSVSYSTANGTAKSGTNYKGTSGVLTIPASALVSGNSTGTIPITAIGAASGQYFSVTLGNAGNAALVPGSTAGQVFIYNPQIAAGTPTAVPSGVTLTSANQLTPIIKAAEANWMAVGANAAAFNNVQLQIANIGNGVLANTAGKVVTIDATADGFGWYVNPSGSAFQPVPNSDAYFARLGSAATGGMDLLTVIEHELGHILGLDDLDGGNSLMATTLATGVRRLP